MYLSHDTSIMAALKQLQAGVLAADLRLDMVQIMARFVVSFVLACEPAGFRFAWGAWNLES